MAAAALQRREAHSPGQAQQAQSIRDQLHLSFFEFDTSSSEDVNRLDFFFICVQNLHLQRVIFLNNFQKAFFLPAYSHVSLKNAFKSVVSEDSQAFLRTLNYSWV